MHVFGCCISTVMEYLTLFAMQYLWSGRHRLDELESLLSAFDLEQKSAATEMYATISESLPLYYNVRSSFRHTCSVLAVMIDCLCFTGLGYSHALQCKVRNVEFNSCLCSLPKHGWYVQYV